MTERAFPKRTPNQATGEIGSDLVSLTVRQVLGWEFRRTPQEFDYGVDGYIDLISDQGYVTGRSLAVQIKTGASYFARKTEHGWTYAGELKHVNYYLNLSVPVLLLLVEPNTREIWWCHFQAYETDRTKTGWSTVVPFANKLNSETRPIFQALAGSHTDYLPHLEGHWMLGEQMREASFLLIQVNRFEIESSNVRPFLRLLERVSQTRESLVAARQKVDFIIDGFNEDPRDLFEIPEVNSWVTQLLSSGQALTYFLDLGPSAQGILTIVSCVCKARRLTPNVVELTAPNAASAFMNQQFELLNTFTEHYEFDAAVNKAISLAFADKIRSMFQSASDLGLSEESD